MKKSLIWTIAGVMGVSLLTLLYLQFEGFYNVYNMRKEQFTQAVTRSLYRTSHNLELYETQERLEQEWRLKNDITPTEEFATDSAEMFRHAAADITFEPVNSSMNEAVRDTVEKMILSKERIGEMLSILYKPSDKSLEERINFRELDSNLKLELLRNGIELPYHFRVVTSDGREVYRCQDYDPEGEENYYRQELFPNDPRAQMGVIFIHFPDMKQYISYGVRFMIPAFIFTLLIILLFSFTIYIIFRQKRLTEIKNDFINNMTHEFKTPISSISLAAQMLSDTAVTKSPTMLKHICKVINDETKRLRFQVEKVLQMSMFERNATTFKKCEVDANALINDVVQTFRLKVESLGGTLKDNLMAEEANVFVDEMHFTNVLFNLMDNAVKYRRESVPLSLEVTTENRDKNMIITISDNGIGIRRDDLKKVFEKFYRVHTGKRHDVKGFGLGLAYVKNVITNLDGSIHAESEYGQGTSFIITLPILKKQ